MAQTTVSVNLSSAVLPFAASFKGQSVIMPNRGDAGPGPNRDFGGDTLEAAVNIPQTYWAENALPTQEGYMSVGYAQIVAELTKEVDYTITVFDGNGAKAMIAVCEDKTAYAISGLNPAWVALSVPAGFNGFLTHATTYGDVYLHFGGSAKIHKFDLNALTLTEVTATGLDMALVDGICDSLNYMIAYGKTTVAWSSALDSLDFVPSDITGAGAGTPDGIKGQIVYCKNIAKGFIIYTSTICMAAEYTGNVRFPWLFRPLNNGSGISDFRHVSNDNALATHFAWTAAGILEVSVLQCTPKFGQLTDFLAGQIWEQYDPETGLIPREKLTAQVRVRCALVASRFFCVSYGKPDRDYYEFVNVYDMVLQRWGRLRFQHKQVVEVVADTEFDPKLWDEMGEDEWNAYQQSWSSLAAWNNKTAKAKKTLGLVTVNGGIHVAEMQFNASGSQGVLVMGKYQLMRGHVCTIQTVLVDGVEIGLNNFKLRDAFSVSGMNFISPLHPMHELTQEDMQRTYGGNNVGKSHSLIFEGAFHITSVELQMTNTGRR